jgi:hypothetical protein
LLAPLIAVAANAADCGSPTDLRDGWTVGAPEEEGLDPALICGIGPRLEAFKEAKAHPPPAKLDELVRNTQDPMGFVEQQLA